MRCEHVELCEKYATHSCLKLRSGPVSEIFSTASQLLENTTLCTRATIQKYKRAVLSALRLDGRNDLFDEQKKVFVSPVQKV